MKLSPRFFPMTFKMRLGKYAYSDLLQSSKCAVPMMRNKDYRKKSILLPTFIKSFLNVWNKSFNSQKLSYNFVCHFLPEKGLRPCKSPNSRIRFIYIQKVVYIQIIF